METISLLRLVQATSGLAGRNNTQLFVNGKPVIEIRITVKEGKTQVNLISTSNVEENDAEPEPETYQVQCDFDSENNQWIYTISIPEKDKEALAEICKSSKIKVEDLLQEFFRWIVRDKESAARWLQGKDEQKKV